MQKFIAVLLFAAMVFVQTISSAPAPGNAPKAVQDLLTARDEIRTEVLRILDLHKVPHTRDGYAAALNKIIQLKPTDSIDTIMMMSVLQQVLATFPGGPFE